MAQLGGQRGGRRSSVDLGSGSEVASQALAAQTASKISQLMAPGAVLVSDQTMRDPDLVPLDLPAAKIKARSLFPWPMKRR